ncbi:cyclin-dependent kinase inhibitor 1C [Apis mellifera caucasica]|uniref:Cyclin-dependent kinase inhibitor 1C n=2 Tax=Apis mellifera TaxID=7460 RepID=A0A7M7GT61_APIME|nr:cyclin-dependent kinase inhibitor 1C [Apis mellifera]KAG6794374.1 cyclin-dependent kinase inhibitor 1C [Apis mellifera caucasica]KAG9429234.1 cyclin-dependent kinase inhibitor 1C [Apis mellifera carnica]|eukprot:XP_006565784.1 cyclin-dependent kinase inhibitor 1C [Apis mellifera]
MLKTLLLAGLLAVALAAPAPAPIPAPAPAPTPSPLAPAALLSAAPLPAAPLPSPVISNIGSPLLYPNYPASISVGYAPAASYIYKSYVI